MMRISLDKILPNPEQPRTEFDPAEMEKLAESIGEHGVLQPIVVEQAEDGYYILHDGERRWRASRMAALTEIPAYITPALNGTGSRDRLVRAMVANLQRSDLNPIEEALAYRRLMDDHGMSIAKVARMMGISAPRVNSRIKLLDLDDPIRAEIIKGRIPKDERTIGALLSIEDNQVRIGLAQRAAERRMTAKGIIEACRRVNEHLREDQLPKNDIPAIHQAMKKSSPMDRARWDALAQVGKVPPWVLFEVSVRDTCKRCSWYEMASESICKECPLPQMVAMMIGKVAR